MTTSTACPSCRAPLTSPARYCHRCGRAVTEDGGRESAAWLIAWVLVAISLGGIGYFLVNKDDASARPDMANTGAPGAPSGGGAPPDISQLTPRERFIRLHDRIMASLERGDSATARRLGPMAISAYGMLGDYDPDVRYHAGVLQLRLGEPARALALADTIQAEANDHLFADLLRTEVAQANGDKALLARSRQAFLAHYAAQLAAGRPEYAEHRAMLEDFRKGLGD